MSRSDHEEQAKRNRERYPLIYAVFVEASEMLKEFGEVKLLCGISIDGAAVGKQPHPGWYEQERAALESRQQAQL